MSIARKLRVYHRLQLSAHRVQKLADRSLLTTADITTAQAAVLAVVAGSDKATQRDVAKQLGLNESAVTGMVTRLLNLDLLEREPHDTDTRAWRLALSKNGRAALKNIEKPFGAINARIESVLKEDEITRLADYLERISNAFDDKKAGSD